MVKKVENSLILYCEMSRLTVVLRGLRSLFVKVDIVCIFVGKLEEFVREKYLTIIKNDI